MKILVDADACPGKKIIEDTASKNSIAVYMYCDISHIITSSYSTIKYVDKGFQSADMALVNDVCENDIVISQDYGVAAMALSKRAYVISPKGYVYDDGNIDKLLFERHISSKIRRAGGKTYNPKKRTAEDDKRLENQLIKIINEKKTIT